MYIIHSGTILSSIHILFSKSFTTISHSLPDVNSNFHFVTKSWFQTPLLLQHTILLGYMLIPEFNYQNPKAQRALESLLIVVIITHFSTSHIHQTTHFIFVCAGIYVQPAPAFYMCPCVIILIASSHFLCVYRKLGLIHTGLVG